MISENNQAPEIASILCRDLGVKMKDEKWLEAHGIEICGHKKNPRGRPSPLIRRNELITVIRSNQDGWPEWKAFEFECKVRGINPIRELALIVFCCAPDSELLKAALNLCLDPESKLLLWVATDDFEDNKDYAYYSLETWIGNDLRKRMSAPNFAERYNNFVRDWDNRSFRDLWSNLKERVKAWPELADRIDYKVFDGALLLGEFVGIGTDKVEVQSFLIRCPAYVKKFQDTLRGAKKGPPAGPLPPEFAKLFVPIEADGIMLPTWLLGQASRYDLSQNIMTVPEIEAYLKQGEFIDYMGRKMTYLHCAWDELKSAGNLLKNHAAKSGIALEWKKVLATLRSWNYRANIDRERGQRKLTSTDIDPISDKDAERGSEVVPSSAKLTQSELGRIFGGINAEQFRKMSPAIRKKTTSSA
jgi:hypothetical protein